ncbi:PepSY domain-containing protein [Acetobacteraceae bacterium KSS8]|uniref:PepSY domain-containing protein n=1 Tax=Endosaccharibacter trunci TaxID=2812733 RepID=A0ABT1W7D0_9PROT|nr:PepSY domain-containing protein [Acetobacteraceae bacterium KSS8]
MAERFAARSSLSLRRWRWWHRWSSVLCTLFLLMLCVTGLPLVFADEIDDALGRLHPARVASSPPSLPIRAASVPDLVVADALRRHPGLRPRIVVFDADAPVIQLRLTRGPDDSYAGSLALSYDRRTGALLRDGEPPGSGVMRIVLGLHRQMLAGLPGELFLGAMGIAFLIAIVSGFVLYAPFMRRLRFGQIRRSGSPRLRWLDTHNLVGACVAAWMVVVGATGIMNTLATPLFGLWVMRDVAPRLAAFRTAPVMMPTATLAAAIASASAAVPGDRVLSVTFPSHLAGSPRHFVVWVTGRTKVRGRLMTPVLVDAATGATVMVARLPWYLRLLELSRPLHFGDYGGLGLKIVWAAFDAATILVLGSGLYLLFARPPSGRRARSEEGRLVRGES